MDKGSLTCYFKVQESLLQGMERNGQGLIVLIMSGYKGVEDFHLLDRDPLFAGKCVTRSQKVLRP